MLGSVKTAVGRISPLAILGRYFLFLRLGAADEDQFGGDLGARAERADADIAARQFLRHDAHRDLAEPHPAIGLGDRQAEHAHVAQGPRSPRAGYRRWRDASLARGDRPRRRRSGAFRRESPRRSRRGRGRRSRLRAPPPIRAARAARFSRVLPVAISASTTSVRNGAISSGPRPKSARRTISPWFIGMPPKICARYSPRPIRVSSSFGLAEAALLAHAPRVGGHFLDRLDIGREPGEAVGGMLLGFDLGGAELAVFAHPFAHGVSAQSMRPSAANWAWRARSSSVTEASLLRVGAVAAPQHASAPPPLQCVFLAPHGQNSRLVAGGARWRRRAKMAV